MSIQMVKIVENYFNRTNTFIRFLLIGVVNTCIGFSLILLLLNVFGLSYWFSTFIGNSIGAIISYTLNKIFTFKSNVSNRKGIIIFILVIFGSYIISYQLGYKIIHDSNVFNLDLYKDEFSVLLAAILYTVLNYLGQRYFTFRQVEGS